MSDTYQLSEEFKYSVAQIRDIKHFEKNTLYSGYVPVDGGAQHLQGY